MKYRIIKESEVYSGFMKIIRAEVEYELFDDNGKQRKNVEVLERGDSVAVLLYDTEASAFLFTWQFRFPSAKKDQKEEIENAGWLIELPAGKIDKNEEPQIAAIREVSEETGYALRQIEMIGVFYVSPGGSSERIHLFYGEVRTEDQITKGGGLKDEKEDIKVVKIPVLEIDQYILSGKIRDAKTIVGLQWWQLKTRH